MLTTGNFEIYQNAISLIFAIIFLSLLTILLVLACIKDAEDQDKKRDYLKTLTDEERLIIAKYEDNKKTKWFNKKPKDK